MIRLPPRVLHITNTPCAGAPGMLSKIVNRYTAWESKVYVGRTKLQAGDFTIDYKGAIRKKQQLQDAIGWANLIHLHNEDPTRYAINKPFIIQLHSEPSVRGKLAAKYPYNSITIGQKHAILYGNIPYIPNLIPIYDNLYSPNFNRPHNHVTITYSPTYVMNPKDYDKTCKGKGYDATKQILLAIKRQFGKKVICHILQGEKKETVLRLKRTSDITIDECVTGGYHLSSLEALASGNIVIGNLSDDVKNLICEITGCNLEELPWVNCSLDNLKDTLVDLIVMKLNSYEEFEDKRKQSTKWMYKYWRPEVRVKKLIKMYNRELGIEDNPWKGLKVSSDIGRVRVARDKVLKIYKRRKKLTLPTKYFLNKHIKQPALIMGNGPSLQTSNIKGILDKYDPKIFCCNFYFKNVRRFFPDYWFCIDTTCFGECINNVPIETTVIAHAPACFFNMENKISWINQAVNEFNSHFNFEYEIERPCTVATMMLLYAIYMRCSPIFISGVDLSLSVSKNNYAYSSTENERFNNKFRDFSKNYLHIIREFKLMHEEAKRMNIQIYNLNKEESNFNVFPVYRGV